MTIGNSGPIGINTLKGEFTASANNLGSYYRNGPIVPGSVPGTTSPGNTRPGNSKPGTARPGTTNPCTGSGPTTPGTASAKMNKVNGTASKATVSYSSGGPSWIWTMQCYPGGGGCGNQNFFSPCNGGNVHFKGIRTEVGAGKTQPAPVRYNFSPGSYSPPSTNPPTTNPPTTNPPVTNNPLPINAPVPTSGTIALSNFYGARKS